MSDKQMKEIYKLVDVLVSIAKDEAENDLFELEFKAEGVVLKSELTPLEYVRVVAMGVSNALIEVVNMEDEEQ
ncbi:Phage protein [Macrococcoides canis]|uniref:Uncharacterized protein n=1 Tax=Macrococcoides canis TaxID=1855823 RepID=A0A1W7AEP2_9STAP|nr:hypothetical protein [Macrococcus canis]ARQ08083.1 hypothetical protein MCCS_25270 [Macrococcus canis]